ncbi:hypothetical protein [Actinomadura sp. HBU206391]|uniref:hypothetical protein n=1 Tax=Actinomadura sp. HBU206391 TaxID=2731692 RepID=UPI00164EDDA4|nr:hypothetical protein [Actinomadura sp. HBU206391]MBC6456975.1 hypothetical protein [Actinomadura sp. HBU206391]
MSTPTPAPSTVDPAEPRQVMARFPTTPIWFGPYTGHWWALAADRLIEAETPAALGDLLAAPDVAVRRPVPAGVEPPAPAGVEPPGPADAPPVRPQRRAAGSWLPPRTTAAPPSERVPAPVG